MLQNGARKGNVAKDFKGGFRKALPSNREERRIILARQWSFFFRAPVAVEVGNARRHKRFTPSRPVPITVFYVKCEESCRSKTLGTQIKSRMRPFGDRCKRRRAEEGARKRRAPVQSARPAVETLPFSTTFERKSTTADAGGRGQRIVFLYNRGTMHRGTANGPPTKFASSSVSRHARYSSVRRTLDASFAFFFSHGTAPFFLSHRCQADLQSFWRGMEKQRYEEEVSSCPSNPPCGREERRSTANRRTPERATP